MAYSPYVIDDFGGGLNLRSKIADLADNETPVCRNVVFIDGAVETRSGYDNLTSALTNPVESLHPYYESDGTTQLLAGCGTRLEAISTAGAVVDSETGLTSTGSPWFWDFARVGTASAEYAYAGNGENVLKRWDGSTWTSVANTPQGGALAVTPSSNRLVVTRFKGTTGGPTGGAGTSNPSRVYFSDPGAPETWTTANYVDLDPGDGEVIQAAITWREYVFVFKESKFYVFTDESTDVDGNPIFNYRKIDTGIGLSGPRAVAASESGVYFVDSRGLYVTTGEAPTKLSRRIDPMFFGGLDLTYFDFSATDYSVKQSARNTIAVGLWQERVYITYGFNASGSSVSRVTLVYDTQDDWWSFWTSIPASCFATFRPAGDEELVFGHSTATPASYLIHRHNQSYTNDNGDQIVTSWRSKYMDFGTPEVKRVRQQKVWGSGGPVLCGVNVDYEADTAPTGFEPSLDFTTDSGAGFNPVHRRVAQRGSTFSIDFAGVSGSAWSIQRVEHHLASRRQPSVVQNEQ